MTENPSVRYRDRTVAALTHGRRRARHLETIVLVLVCFACVVAFLALALALALLILVVIA